MDAGQRGTARTMLDGVSSPLAALDHGSPDLSRLRGARPWDPESDVVLICRRVWNETPDVKTFVFSAAEPRRFDFQPGQFMTWEFEIGGRRVNRCYTIASSAARPHMISITVKRVLGGEVSPWLHENLRPGVAVRALGPAGSFIGTPRPGGKYLFLSGGSGITPLMAMARTHEDLAGDADIAFVHNARSPPDIIFRSELAALARHHAGFRFVPICEADSPTEAWHGMRGRLDAPMLALIAPDLAEREVFTCGPAGYMAAVRAMLGAAGFDMARYHEESFCFADLAPSPETPPAMAEAAGAGFRVQFRQSERSVLCAPGTSILESALAAGMRLPFSCSQGICGTCKSRMVSGSVDMQHQGGIRRREVDQGMILLCCSRPTSDLVIDR
jgi:glycine betaine catabolism B